MLIQKIEADVWRKKPSKIDFGQLSESQEDLGSTLGLSLVCVIESFCLHIESDLLKMP